MLSKNKIKFIQSLHKKKFRSEFGLFLVEGEKNMLEFLDSDFCIEEIFVTETFVKNHKKNIGEKKYTLCSQKEIEKISTFKTNSAGVFLVKQKENRELEVEKNELILVLDGIADPGNLGTIIRICDWYGVKKIIISENTIEIYHPKVVSSTMGSLKRVQIFRTNLEIFFKEKKDSQIFGAFLEGKNIHSTNFGNKGGYLIIGSESHGISEEIEKIVTEKITIPRFGQAESLNAGVACGIILDSMKRN